MAKITYLIGDATNPQIPGNKIICHICNDIGAWGAGFVLALSRKWRQPEASYRRLKSYQLGEVDLVKVEDDIYVANMIAQHGVARMGFDDADEPPIRYAAVEECLDMVNIIAGGLKATIHMPRIGCGLAGGRWEEIEAILQKCIDDDVQIYVYDLPQKK